MPKTKRKNSKKTIAYEKIRELINDPHFAQADLLTETELAERLKISRTPIREALIELQSEGFLRIVPNRGIIIEEPSISEVRNLYDIRIALEQFIMRELSGTLEEKDFKALEEILQAQEECLEETKTSEFLALDKAFHSYFFEKYSNPLMHDFFLKLRDRLFKVSYRMLQSNENMRCFHHEHHEILQELRSASPDRAVAQMSSHLKGAKRRLL